MAKVQKPSPRVKRGASTMKRGQFQMPKLSKAQRSSPEAKAMRAAGATKAKGSG